MLPEERDLMIYKIATLVDKGLISFEGYKSKDFANFQGSLGEVVDVLGRALESSDEDKSTLDLFLYSPRLLRGIIEHSLNSGTNEVIRKRAIEKFGVDVFAGRYDSASGILNTLHFTDSELKSRVNEIADSLAWNSFDPHKMDSLLYGSEGYQGLANNRTDFIVADGHGAYIPSFMAAAAIGCDVRAVKNHCISGTHNRKPTLINGEAELLYQELKGKYVVVMGDDVTSGTAIQVLSDFIKKKFNPADIKIASPLWVPPSEYLDNGKPDFYGVMSQTT